MTYKELQKEATALGINPVGLKAKELAAKIAEAKGEETPAKTKDEKPEHNAAIVYDKNSEVRQYTKELHGEEFAELAYQFATKKKYRVELVTLKAGIACPACGHVFNP